MSQEVEVNEQAVQSQLSKELQQKYLNMMQNIGSIYNDIHKSFQKLEGLREDSIMIKENKFIKSFLNIMNKMSSQLQKTNEAINNIDQEINADPQCVYLEQQLLFFQNQCLHNQKLFEEKKRCLKQEEEKYSKIERQNQRLTNELKYQTKKDIKYKSKTKSLLQKSVQMQIPCQTHRQFYRSKSISHRNYSLQFDLQSKPSRNSIRSKQKVPTSIAEYSYMNKSDFQNKF